MKQGTYRRGSCRRDNQRRELLKKGLNLLCRFGVVFGFVCFIGIWGGMEIGPIMIGTRLLWSLVDIIFFLIMIRLDQITAGGSDDEIL